MSPADLDVADSGQIIISISPDNGDIRNDASKTVLLTTQLAFALSIGTISFLLFCFLRTRWNAMYAPRSRLNRLAPKPLPNTFFGWIIPLFKIRQSEVLDRVGLDATVLLAFYKMSYKLFAFCGIFALIILSPLKIYKFLPRIGKDDNLFDGNSTDPTDPDDPNKSPAESSEILLSYMVLTWVISLATYYFTFYNYREFSIVRHRYYLKWKNTITARSVMVTVIPKKLQTDHALTEFYNSLNLGPVERATVYRQVRKLRHAIELRAEYLRKLEQAYVQYLGNPCDDPNYDPDLAIKEFKKALEEEEDPFTANDKIAAVLDKVGAKRPTMRTGFLGLFGKEVDKIGYYTKLFIQYDLLVKRGRLGAYVSTSTGFVTFKDIASAQMAAQVLLRPEPFQCSTELAPEPRDVFWYKLNIRKREMLARDVVVNGLVILLAFTWTIPTTFFASLLTLNSLKKILPWLAGLAEKNKILKGFIQGTLPPLAVVTLNAMIPQVLTSLSKLQGLNSRSAIESSTFAKYFFFLLFNVLLIFTIAGTAFNAIQELVNNPTGIALTLAKSLPKVSPFFINYVILQGIGLYPFRILMIKDIIMAYLTRVFYAHTPREFAESSTPQVIDYGQELPPIVLVFILVLVYSSLTPIILLFGAIFFLLGYMCYKYLLLFVYFHPYESAGHAWPKIFRRITVGLYIFQLLMIGYMSLRKSFYLAVALMPLLVVTTVYYYYVNEAYNRSSAFLPLNILRKDQEESTESSTNTSVTFKPRSQDSKIVAANDTSEGSTANTSSNNNKNDEQEQGYSQRDVLEDDLYVAAPDLYTDYTQPPMTLYNGILNTGMRDYTPPELTGTLPWLWLPVKRKDENNYGGFIRRLLGMNSKASQPGLEVDSTIDSTSTERDRPAKTAGSSSSLSGQSTSYGAVGTTEQFTAEPEQIIITREEPSTSFAANRQDTTTKRKSKASMMADKIGEFAGSNFS